MHTGNTPQGFLLIRCVCLLPSFFSLFFPYYSFLSSFVFCDFNMPEFTRYKKRISYRFSHREKKSCVFSAAGSLTSSSSVPRRPPPPDGVSGLRHPRCTPPTSTFFPLLTFFSFLLYIPFFNSFSFFVYLYLYIFLFFFFLCVSLCVHIALLSERNGINCR